MIDTVKVDLVNYKLLLKRAKENASICTLLDTKNDTLKLSLSTNLLDYFMIFLLKYYKDGVGEADHIDLDFEYKKT